MKRKKRDEKRWAPGKRLFWVFIRFPFFIYLWHTTASVTWASPFLSTSLLDAIAICQKRNLFSRWPITYPAYGLEHIVRNG